MRRGQKVLGRVVVVVATLSFFSLSHSTAFFLDRSTLAFLSLTVSLSLLFSVPLELPLLLRASGVTPTRSKDASPHRLKKHLLCGFSSERQRTKKKKNDGDGRSRRSGFVAAAAARPRPPRSFRHSFGNDGPRPDQRAPPNARGRRAAGDPGGAKLLRNENSSSLFSLSFADPSTLTLFSLFSFSSSSSSSSFSFFLFLSFSSDRRPHRQPPQGARRQAPGAPK